VRVCQAGSEQEDQECNETQADNEGYCRPREEQRRSGVVVAGVGQGSAVPLVPLVPQTPIYIYMDELCSRAIGHRGEHN
jgi:hypothetical protein